MNNDYKTLLAELATLYLLGEEMIRKIEELEKIILASAK